MRRRVSRVSRVSRAPRAPRARAALAAALLALLASACVPKGKYDQLAQSSAEAEARSVAQKQRDDKYAAELRDSLKATEGGAQARDQKLSELTTANHNLQAKLDEATSMNLQLRTEIEKTGKDVDQILRDRGTLTKALDDARARLTELRRAQSAADARLALFKSFEQRFSTMIGAGQLTIGSRAGRLALTVPGDLLFDRGRVDIKATGKGALLEIAKGISAVLGRKFQIAAHTDGATTPSTRYPTNWELSALRAVEIVKLFLDSGVPAANLAAAGYADSEPIDRNDAAKNRRVEISLSPAAEDLVVTPEWRP